MDHSEIASRGKKLNKLADSGEASEITVILEELKKGVKATEELLRSTRIGIIVNKQRQHKNPEVARLASEIVLKWRSDVHKGTKGAGTPKHQKSNGSSPQVPNGDSTPTSGGKSAGQEGKITVPLADRTWKKDSVDIKRTGVMARDNCIGLLYDGLVQNTEEVPVTVLKRAMEVERAAFATFGSETSGDYKSKMRSLYQNLKNKSNPNLRLRVLAGEISPERFVSMSHEELMSAEKRAETLEIQKQNMNNAMVAQAERSISSSLQCGKCGQRKVSYTQAQTRSADEPMTTFCECMACGKRWKFS